MNKTVNINIGGLFFHIDENAFSKLSRYLTAINQSLVDDPQGKEEIIKDIEQRISELFTAKLTKERQVINEKDVDEVIAIMGQPEDYQFDNELFNDAKTQTNSQHKSSGHKKLYRSGKDKILGGVASGLGHYMGMDPTWIRIIWLLLMIPWGFSFWIYILMWIIVPEAKTTSEELEMKGEPVTIDNIEKKIKDEYADLENRIKNADYSHVKNGFQQIIDTLGNIFQVLFKVFGKFIGVILIVVAALTLIGLIIGLFSWGTFEMIGNQSNIHYPEFFELSVIPKWLLTLSLLFAIMIPFVFLFILGINILSRDKKTGLGMTGNLALVGVWLLSLFVLIFAGVEYGTQSSNENFISQNAQFKVDDKDTIFVKMINNDLIANRKSLYRSRLLEEVTDEKGKTALYSSYVHIDVRKSSNDQMMVKVLKTANGSTKENANQKAQKINYQYAFQDNHLNLNSYFLTEKDVKYNKPKVDVIIYIPENKIIYLDYSTSPFLFDVHNVQDIYDSDMANHYYMMKEEGLNCTDCAKDTINLNGVDVDINPKGVNINIENEKDKVKVKIDGEGVEVR